MSKELGHDERRGDEGERRGCSVGGLGELSALRTYIVSSTLGLASRSTYQRARRSVIPDEIEEQRKSLLDKSLGSNLRLLENGDPESSLRCSQAGVMRENKQVREELLAVVHRRRIAERGEGAEDEANAGSSVLGSRLVFRYGLGNVLRLFRLRESLAYA